MAKVTIESALVERIIDGWGFKATETVTIQGEERKVWYTVWTKAAVSEGDKVSITGELGVKLEEFTGRDNTPKMAAAAHINNAQVSGGSDAPF